MAWSGGLDSTVLLHLLAGARQRGRASISLRAVHVDHGLQTAAADFRRFCRETARTWRVPLTVLRIHVPLDSGRSVEEAAREARYAALAGYLQPGELLLTAQHADDQLETLLLALMRGAGPSGLAGMPLVAGLGKGRLVRPLLGEARSALAAYAARHALAWQEDPSNAQQRFDRNYLRAQVLPALQARWPAAARTAGRSAAHCAVAAEVLERGAARDLQAAADGADLEIAVLRRWQPWRCAAVLRLWMARRGLRMPEQRQLDEIQTLMAARPDANPQLNLPGATVRRHGGRLLIEILPEHHAESSQEKPCLWTWQGSSLQLPGGRLQMVEDVHGDLDLDKLPHKLIVQWPSQPSGRPLRKLMQELMVPSWQRTRLPLLLAGGKEGRAGRLLAIADLWLTPSLRTTVNTVKRGRILWRETR